MLRESSGSGGSPPPSLIPIFEPLPPRSESRIRTVGVGVGRGGGGVSPAPPTAAAGIEFPGRHKWLGGAVDAYTAYPPTPPRPYAYPPPICPLPTPKIATSRIRTRAKCRASIRCGLYPYPPESVLPVCQANGGRFKWLREVVCNGYLYGIPAWATTGVLRVDIAALWGRRRGREEGAEE